MPWQLPLVPARSVYLTYHTFEQVTVGAAVGLGFGLLWMYVAFAPAVVDWLRYFMRLFGLHHFLDDGEVFPMTNAFRHLLLEETLYKSE